jgi:hypothetical protein
MSPVLAMRREIPTLACVMGLILASGSSSDTNCPDGIVGGCARCKGVGYEEGDQFGTCELPGSGPASLIPPDLLEPADNCYEFRKVGFCFSGEPGVECPDEFLCCPGGEFGYWTCDQIVWGSCAVEQWCNQFCCVNEPTLRTQAETCPGAPETQIHYCE